MAKNRPNYREGYVSSACFIFGLVFSVVASAGPAQATKHKSTTCASSECTSTEKLGPGSLTDVKHLVITATCTASSSKAPTYFHCKREENVFDGSCNTAEYTDDSATCKCSNRDISTMKIDLTVNCAE